MQIIKNNPYRTVGLLVGATAAEQRRQITRLNRRLEAYQEPEDDFSFSILGEIHRTIEMINDASSKLNLDSDKMKAALFWFYMGNPITDEPAFNYLKEGDLSNPLLIWTKQTLNGDISERNASAFSNLGTLFLSGVYGGPDINEEHFEQGIIFKLTFLESDFIMDLKRIATDETYRISKKELQLLFLNQVQSEIEKNGEISSNKLLDIIANQEFSAKDVFLERYSQKSYDQLEKSLNDCKTHRKTNKEYVAAYGDKLFNEALPILKLLGGIYGNTNLKYKSISDRVSNEILQCGIQHFYDYKDHATYDPGEYALELLLKAKKLAIGNIVKQRCQENIDSLEEWINNKSERDFQHKIGKEVKFIVEQINLAAITLKNKGKYPKGYNDPYSKLPFNEQPHNADPRVFSISSIHFNPTMENEFNINHFRLARDIVNDCKPELEKIKLVVGSKNEIYNKLSNDVATIALACLIAYVNGEDTLVITRVSESVINSMRAIGELDMNIEMRKRYNEQHQSLNNLIRKIQKERSKRSNNSGCYIATMAYGHYHHPQVIVLRHFRDNVLDKSKFGKWFIKTYYHYSPRLVEKMSNKRFIKFIIRITLDQFVKLVKQ